MSKQNWGDKMERWWKAYKHKMIQFIGSLIMERNEDGRYVASLGRISFWAVLVPALHIWITGKGMMTGGEAATDVSPNHLTLLLSLLGYNMSKKLVDGVGKTVVIMKGGNPNSGPPEPQDGPG